MLNQPLRFRNFVASGGYEWIEGRLIDDNWKAESEIQQFLVPVNSSSRRGLANVYKANRVLTSEAGPESGMFLKLSHLGVSTNSQLKQTSALPGRLAPLSLVGQAAICEFANRYGDLGGHQWAMPANQRIRIPASIKKSGKKPSLISPWDDACDEDVCRTLINAGAFCGESLLFWQEHVAFLRFCTDLWEACKENDEEFLSSWVVVDNVQPGSPSHVTKSVHFTRPPNLKPFKVAWNKLVHQWSFEYGIKSDTMDIFKAAQIGVANQIEFRLSGNLNAHRSVDFERNRAVIRLNPRNLAVAIWAQFAVAFNEDKEYVHCANCDNVLELTPEIARTNRRTCSGRCRAAFHRKRQKRAIHMRRDGATLRQIAKEIDSDMATIKKWVSSK